MKPVCPEKLVSAVFYSPSQVTIEVVDGLESHEAEKGLRKERKPNWRNWWPHSSSFPTRHNEEHVHNYGANNEDSNFLRPPADWDRRGGGKAQTEYGEDGRWQLGLPALICADPSHATSWVPLWNSAFKPEPLLSFWPLLRHA